MSDETEVPVRAFSTAAGSIASMSDTQLLEQQPSGKDPAVVAVHRARMNGTRFDRTKEEIEAARATRNGQQQPRRTSSGKSQAFSRGDKVYHKGQKVEGIYAGEDPRHNAVMCEITVGGKKFRVQKENLVKL